MTLGELEKKRKKLPDAPGVYFFLGPHKKILYIGKAASLQGRVRSYFSTDLLRTRSPLIAQMVEQARFLDWRQTDSVLEALILEASLIKTYKPKANTDLKDDKSFNYVVITKEDFPRVLLVRGRDLRSKFENRRTTFKAIFGPFPHGSQLKEAMKIIRKIFPYRDTCIPGQGKPCFNRQIGFCPGVCTGEISKMEYARIIRHLVLFFEGRKKALCAELERDMKHAATKEDFELAKELRRQLFALRHIQDVSLIKDEYRSPFGNFSAFRIEAYDVAHLRGAAPVGVMVVVEGGVVNTKEYRTFHIRQATGGDDAGALREVLLRRLAHDEWPYPRLIVVDGAKAQMNVATKVVSDAGMHVPIVGVVKNERHQPRGILGDKALIRERESDILRANAEAHRFAIARHRRRMRLNLK